MRETLTAVCRFIVEAIKKHMIDEDVCEMPSAEDDAFLCLLFIETWLMLYRER